MTTSDPIPARLAALKTTPTRQLKTQWRDLFETAIAALPSLEREKIRTETARAFYLGGADKDLSA